MSASASRLTELPNEVLEQILLHLPAQNIIKVEVVNRRFRDLTRDSPTLRYKRDLFSAGLVENPYSPCNFARRRKLCEEHKRKWSNSGRAAKAVHKLPEELFTKQRFSAIHGKNFITSYDVTEGPLGVVRIPPVTSQKSIEWWSIPRFPCGAFAVHPPDNVLAVAEEKERFVCVHFLNLSDGSPRSAPPSNVTWELPGGVNEVCVEDLAITGSRIMMRVLWWEAVGQGDTELCRVLVWDWETGDLVLNLSSTDDSTPIEGDSKITFLDEYRMVVFTLPHVPEFTLFDTFVPRGQPVVSRRFQVPPRCYDWFPTVSVDDDQRSGTRERDRPLTTDPTRAIFALKLGSPQGLRIWLIVRIQTLIEHVRSMGADTCVPWDEWRRGAVVMDVSKYDNPISGLYPLVHGTNVIVVERSTTPGIDGYHHHIRTFDFGRQSWNVLPLHDEGHGVERRATFEEGRTFLLQGNKVMGPWAFRSLGDGKFMYLDYSSGLGLLHVWELI